MTRALFLDRDGTINVDYGYVHEPERFELVPGVLEFCSKAQSQGYAIIVVTNQSGIERGYFTEGQYLALESHMLRLFSDAGVRITDVFHCASLTGPDRKPEPGMFLKAMKKHNINMKNSVNIGDKERDLEAGRRAGVGRNLLFTGDWELLAREMRF